MQDHEHISKSNIRHDIVSISKVYSPELSFTHLVSSDTLEVSVVVKGSGIHQISNQAIPCKQGDAYVVRADIPHRYFLNSPDECLIIRRLYFDVIDWFDTSISDPDSVRFCYGIFSDNSVFAYAMLNAKTQSTLFSLLDLISDEIEEQNTDWHDCVKAHLTLLLITIGRYVNSAIKDIPSFSPKEWKIISMILSTISSRFHESDLTLEAIARSMFISKSNLSRLFKRLTGKSFSEYLKSIRLSHACDLLKNTTLNVDEIVLQCGLKDIPSFYHSFHAYTGMKPSQYRNIYNKNQNNDPKGEKIMIILSEISENLQRGKAKIVKEMVQQAIDEGCEPEKILNEGLLDGMNVIGEKFKNNEVYVPEVLVAARAMNMGVAVLKPHLASAGVQATGKVCIGTVQGDLHDIGKNLVRMMMEGKGLEVVDLGVDVPAEKFVQTAIDEGCQVICCSALLTTTMNVMADVVKLAEEKGIRDKVKIMVGGAPVNDDFCKSIGADCYTTDAASAADAAVELCKSV